MPNESRNMSHLNPGQTAELTPISLAEARRFVAEHHRHNDPPRGWLFGVALREAGVVVAVAIAGRPTARMMQDGRTVEITRVTTLGGENACSRLYGALCRAAKALGYLLAITYTLASEPGTSLRASGFEAVAEVKADNWNRPSRPRVVVDLFGNTKTPAGDKVRWERRLVA